MSFSESFDIGYLKTYAELGEEIFLSVTPNLRRGPGIQRDGLTAPRMTDPHTVQDAWGKKRIDDKYARLPENDNPYIQRSGTWTLFHHVNKFIETHGKNYRLIGVQSCGDLTMNPWHVALIKGKRRSHLCRLATPGDFFQEPIHERNYRCLVKWKKRLKKCQYEFIDLKFIDHDGDYITRIVDDEYLVKEKEWLKSKRISPDDITSNIEFALSGKPVIQKGHDIALANVIDYFEDVRHIFNLPSVPAHGAKGKVKINKINFGEHILFTDLNARRGALHSSIIVDLVTPQTNVSVDWDEFKKVLKDKHYRKTKHSPTRSNEYRKYSENSVEIYFPYNVYPFGVIGGHSGHLVCLASGGLSGRVGNTLEGISRIMYDFFGCEDAIVLDEGYDTFHIINPNLKKNLKDKDIYTYDNDEILEQIASFTKWRVEKDLEDCIDITNNYPLGNNFLNWPLNIQLFEELNSYCKKIPGKKKHKRKRPIISKPANELDCIAVEPHRSQMRAVIIFAQRRECSELGHR